MDPHLPMETTHSYQVSLQSVSVSYLENK